MKTIKTAKEWAKTTAPYYSHAPYEDQLRAIQLDVLQSIRGAASDNQLCTSAEDVVAWIDREMGKITAPASTLPESSPKASF